MSETEELKKMVADLVKQMSAFMGAMPMQSECKYTLSTWLYEWVETYKAPKLRPRTLEDIRARIRLHILTNLPDKKIDSYSALEIQQALNAVKNERTRQCVYNIYNGAFTQAYRLKLIPENFMPNVEKIKHTYKAGKAMTQRQQKEFLSRIRDNRLETLYLFYLYTGCRRAEALAVKWSDVDTAKNVLHIEGTKTEGSKRTIPIFAPLQAVLQTIPKTSQYIFPYTSNKVKCNFRRLQQKLSFSLRLHDLRHTFATRCIESGISLKVVQLWLGHSNMQTTANIYSHILNDFEREEAAKFKL